MAWTAPRTWAGGEILTATNLNTHVRDNMKELWHEINYTEFTAPVTGTTALADVVSSGAITYVANPTSIEFYTPEVSGFSIGAATMWFYLFDGATELGKIAIAEQTLGGFGGGTVVRRITPTAASHTYKISCLTSSGTAVISAGAGGAGNIMPGYIRIMQKGG